MYLKSLKMQGFKSFPDPTLIEFHEGITAVVGPNGSGKSNITDAIRWVLGEQSAKSLRGSRMEDVIFSGTETRRQLGFVEVSITFDNADHLIPIEYDTVEVTRRYYRSGESEFLLNQVQCRLKDIRELFLDTGIGRDGYSIIGQGKIDQILSENSDDRRKVFDEAAGIVKYKLRKQDTERKLERTENNLLRLEDILSELELRLKPLQKQAEKLKAYRSLSEEMKKIDLALLLHDIRRNDEELKKSEAAFQDISADLDEARDLAQDLRDNFHRYDHLLAEIDQNLDQQRVKQVDLQADLAELGEKKAISSERRRALTRQIERNNQQLLEAEAAVKYLDSNLSQRISEKEAAQKEILKIEEALASATDKLSSLQNAMHRLVKTEAALQEQLDNIQNRNFQYKNERVKAEQEITFLQEQLAADQKQLKAAEAEALTLTNQLAEKSALLNENKQQFSAQSAELEKARQRVEEKRRELGELDEQKRRLLSQFENTKYRLHTLENLEQSHEGFHYAVRAIMKKAENDAAFGRNLHGPLAGLIKVPRQFEKAIEISLGAAVNYLVTSDRETAKDMINWLKQNKAGRETFLPLDVIRGNTISDAERATSAKVDGYLGVAGEKVISDPIYHGIIDQLLGRVLLARDMDSALRISAALNQRYRVVTLDGDIVQVGGSMTGGTSKKDSGGLLRRNREIEQARTELEELKRALDQQEETLNKENQSFMLLGQQLKDIESRYLHEEKLIFQSENELAQLNREKQLLEQSIGKIKLGIKSFSDRKTASEKLLTEQDDAIAGVDAEQNEIRQQLGVSNKEKAEQEIALRDQQNVVIDLQVQLRTVQQSLHSLSQLAEHAGRDFSERKAQIERLKTELSSADSELKELAEAESCYAESYLSLQDSLEQVSGELRQKQAERSEIEKKQHQLFAESEEQSALVANLQLTLERAKQKTDRLNQSINSAKNYIWETYEMMYVSLDPADYPLENITAAREKLKSLKEQIKELGSINPNALEEFREVSERFEFMSLQKEDIEKSKAGLNEVIRELETAMSEQFLTNFSEINRHFKDVFSALFIGGEAELALETDDPLTSGIQIKAQPPGKRLQNLNLLSGGERSLTAIALLLAIFRLRPAPFCVLDEVESALDESNIIRFTDYLESYIEHTQFILVTHRKGTMEAADRLYGITMKERGVSKVISLELTDADAIDNDGNIR